MIKTCKRCKKDKDEVQFPISVRKGNKVYRRSECKACWVTYVNSREPRAPKEPKALKVRKLGLAPAATARREPMHELHHLFNGIVRSGLRHA